MRPFVLRPVLPASLLLLLSGCAGSGFGGFVHNTFSTGGDQNRPQEVSETVARANGAAPKITPIASAGGNVWPGPIKPLPSLADIAKTLPETETAPPSLPPTTVPSLGRNPPASLRTPETAPAVPRAGGASAAPAASAQKPSVPTGTMVTTSQGQEKVSGGTGNFLTLTGPSGQYAGIMVPNGNGTSTIIRPGGAVETVPTPK